MGRTGIQWTWVRMPDGFTLRGETWNPTVGCKRCSAGCDNCYAFTLHDLRHVAWKRGKFPDAPEQYHLPFSQVQLLPERLGDPLGWRTRRGVFVDSMSDLFEERVPDSYIERVFGIMASTPQHIYMILTKRPERMRDWVLSHTHQSCVAQMLVDGPGLFDTKTRKGRLALERVGAGWAWPLPNVWLGTSTENQEMANLRIPYLLQTPAAVRFISDEPCLEDINLAQACWGLGKPRPTLDVEARQWRAGANGEPMPAAGLDWVIIGGESGRRARPMQLEWVESMIAQCRAAGVAPFVKQLGTVWHKGAKGRHYHGGIMEQWPEQLRVREWPTSRLAAQVA